MPELIAWKTLPQFFSREHHFRPLIFNVTCWFRIVNIHVSFLKSTAKYSYGCGARGTYLAHQLLSRVEGGR